MIPQSRAATGPYPPAVRVPLLHRQGGGHRQVFPLGQLPLGGEGGLDLAYGGSPGPHATGHGQGVRLEGGFILVIPADSLRHLVFLGVGFQAGVAGFHQEPQGLAHHHALPLVASTAGIQVVHPIFPAVGQIIKPAHGLWDACAGLLVVVLGDGDLPGVRVGGPGGLDGIIPHVRGRGDGAEFMLHMVPPLLGRLEFRWPGGWAEPTRRRPPARPTKKAPGLPFQRHNLTL